MTVSKDNAQIVAKVLSDDNNEEKKRAFARIEELKKKRKDVVIDYDAELAFYREDKYSKLPNDNLKRMPVDWDSFVIPSERGQHVDEYMKEMRDDDSFIPHS